ncbi:type II secretion system protein [Dielma fastidiosa]|uniref:Prepilin-type N-terminal cleavage/methylation domain-containing protein n=1 Tax=Dielma fastidiosa TaxID=1034346 RepID=A0AB35UM61_9FIRM|nr:prepilin-type N-terminal cleavage/methylation domain-containing protein [Dielma fastidiosa]MDY5167855.1 prepilin-type N-terminal cleavage/methylation domain-containing protein [Dielma fastidiosa]
MKNKKGFTLIELIVVIAILGILALFLVPQFMGYADDAKRQVAKANLRTVWSAAKAVEVAQQYDTTINADNFNEKVIEKLGSSFDADEVDVEFDGEKGIVISATYSTGDYICDTINGSDINCTIYRGD